MPSSKEIRDFERGIEEHPDRPRVICFGDSWFNYPLTIFARKGIVSKNGARLNPDHKEINDK